MLKMNTNRDTNQMAADIDNIRHLSEWMQTDDDDEVLEACAQSIIKSAARILDSVALDSSQRYRPHIVPLSLDEAVTV